MTSPCHSVLVPSLVSEGNPGVVDQWVAVRNTHNFYCCAEKCFVTAAWCVGEVFLLLPELPISSCLLQTASPWITGPGNWWHLSCVWSGSLHAWLCTADVSFWLQRIWNKLIQCEFLFWPAYYFLATEFQFSWKIEMMKVLFEGREAIN